MSESFERPKESACCFWTRLLDETGWGYGKLQQEAAEEVLAGKYELHADVIGLIHAMLLRKGAKIKIAKTKRTPKPTTSKPTPKPKKWKKRLGLTGAGSILRKAVKAFKTDTDAKPMAVIRELELRKTVIHQYKEEYSDAALSGRFQSDFVQLLLAEDLDGAFELDATSGKPQRLAVGLFGASFVGKSTIAIRLMTDTFFNEYDPTIEDVYVKRIDVDELGTGQLTLDLMDTAGVEDFSSLIPQWIREHSVFVIVERMQSTALLRPIETEKWIQRVRKGKEESGAVIVLVAVGLDSALGSAHKCTQTRQMIALAKKYNLPYLELSCKSAVDAKSPLQQVTELFQFVAKYAKLYQTIRVTAFTMVTNEVLDLL